MKTYLIYLLDFFRNKFVLSKQHVVRTANPSKTLFSFSYWYFQWRNIVCEALWKPHFEVLFNSILNFWSHCHNSPSLWNYSFRNQCSQQVTRTLKMIYFLWQYLLIDQKFVIKKKIVFYFWGRVNWSKNDWSNLPQGEKKKMSKYKTLPNLTLPTVRSFIPWLRLWVLLSDCGSSTPKN